MLSAEEILCSTQQVIAGLEALRGENRSLLENLQGTSQSAEMAVESDCSVEREKSGIIRQSLDRIELGLSEAQVESYTKSKRNNQEKLCPCDDLEKNELQMLPCGT